VREIELVRRLNPALPTFDTWLTAHRTRSRKSEYLSIELHSQNGTPSVGSLMTLRDRKKDRTRRTVQMTALELFERNGYLATTVEQIAAEAEVSPATFFRYFGSKEAVLFADEEALAASMVAHVAARADRAVTVAALAEPIVAFAAEHGDLTSLGERQMRVVMRTKALELRSMRLRYLWERGIAKQLAEESGELEPLLHHELVAGLAVSCYVAALREWPRRGTPLATLAREAFDLADALSQPHAYASTTEGSS
jgi:AcrR family transcriptional regulator